MARWRKTLKMDFSDCEIKTIVEWTWNKKKKKKKPWYCLEAWAVAFQTPRKTDEWQRVADSVNRVGSRQPCDGRNQEKWSDFKKLHSRKVYDGMPLSIFVPLCFLHHIKLNSELDRCLTAHLGLEQQKY